MHLEFQDPSPPAEPMPTPNAALNAQRTTRPSPKNAAVQTPIPSTHPSTPHSTQSSPHLPELPLPLLLAAQLLTPRLLLTHRHARLRSARDRLANDGKPVFRILIAAVGRADVPHIGFERVAAAANAHFHEIAHGVLGFGETCIPSQSV